MVAAALALSENRLPDAEGALRGRLREDATDVAAIRMLAEVAGRLGRYEDADKLLSRALQLAPGFGAALREVGRIERTLFTLRWFDDPALRRTVTAELNKGEEIGRALV